jgi:hypothetical protein
VANSPFNPLDKRRLGESVASALLKRPVGPLPPAGKFEGAGVYAIYYTGDVPFYKPVAEQNRGNKYGRPIYVGKAVPPGARKGGFGLDTAPGPALFNRLREHSQSLEDAGLDVGRFPCRYLVADDIWIPLGESLLIEMFRPLWNVVIEGFGNHDPGRGRQGQVKSAWDTLHPGRRWAAGLPANPRRPEELRKMVTDFLAGRKVAMIPPEKAVTEE